MALLLTCTFLSLPVPILLGFFVLGVFFSFVSRLAAGVPSSVGAMSCVGLLRCLWPVAGTRAGNCWSFEGSGVQVVRGPASFPVACVDCGMCQTSKLACAPFSSSSNLKEGF